MIITHVYLKIYLLWYNIINSAGVWAVWGMDEQNRYVRQITAVKFWRSCCHSYPLLASVDAIDPLLDCEAVNVHALLRGSFSQRWSSLTALKSLVRTGEEIVQFFKFSLVAVA